MSLTVLCAVLVPSLPCVLAPSARTEPWPRATTSTTSPRLGMGLCATTPTTSPSLGMGLAPAWTDHSSRIKLHGGAVMAMNFWFSGTMVTLATTELSGFLPYLGPPLLLVRRLFLAHCDRVIHMYQSITLRRDLTHSLPYPRDLTILALTPWMASLPHLDTSPHCTALHTQGGDSLRGVTLRTWCCGCDLFASTTPCFMIIEQRASGWLWLRCDPYSFFLVAWARPPSRTSSGPRATYHLRLLFFLWPNCCPTASPGAAPSC